MSILADDTQQLTQNNSGKEFLSAVLLAACFVVFFFAYVLPRIIEATT